MGRDHNGHTTLKPGQTQVELPLFTKATIIVPTIKLPQPDGSILIKPGKPYIAPEEVTVREAAEILGLSTRTIEHQCDIGQFTTAHKPGGRPRSMWRIHRSEVLARKTRPAD